MTTPTAVLLTLASCALLGFRHGFDYDHIAAITDITSVGERGSEQMRNSLMYALGHAATVAAMASAAIFFHLAMPAALDHWMERLVGITLIVLAIYILARLATTGSDGLPASRGMLLIRAGRWVYRSIVRPAEISKPHIPVAGYTASAAFGVGIIHGVGAETPSQLTLFLLAANLGGTAKGFLGLAMFLAGLLVMNTLMAASACGVFRFSARRSTLRLFSGLTAAYSLVIGIVFLFGLSGRLPNLS